jgi:predicted PurR-regulated permease PerM
MSEMERTGSDQLSRDLVEAAIRIGLIALLVVTAFRIFSPFVSLMLWAVILAVALYPLHRRLARRLGGRSGTSATLIVLIGLVLIGVPTVNIGGAFVGEVHELYELMTADGASIRPPDPSVAEWPLIGEKIYEMWSAASTDLAAFFQKMQPQIGKIAQTALGVAASTMGAVLLFLGALIVAGVMMAFGESGSNAMLRIINRLAGPVKGPQLHALSTGTIRSVATGVIGVAFIQALLLGVGFALAGIPGAGILAVVALLVGIIQLPPLLLTLPVIAYLWGAGDSSTVVSVIWTVYLLIAGASDNVLKPLLLGRGIDVPMPVVLIGALGGMASAGMVGLFLGAVILGVGYQIFMDWVDEDPAAQPQDGGSEEPAAGA